MNARLLSGLRITLRLFFYLLYLRDNLIAEMVSGRQRHRESQGMSTVPAWRIVPGIVLAATVVWVVVNAFWAGLPGEILSFDSLLLILICLLLATMFGFCFFWLARDLGLRERLKRKPRSGLSFCARMLLLASR